MYRGILVVLLVVTAAAVSAFGGSEDPYIRKYAMMKVYESCFGPDVVKEVRKEMKDACAKCAAMSHASPMAETPAAVPVTVPPGGTKPSRKHTRPVPQAPATAQFDASKLQQAIIGYKHQNNEVQPPQMVYNPQGWYSSQQQYHSAPNNYYAPQYPTAPLFYPADNSYYTPQGAWGYHGMAPNNPYYHGQYYSPVAYRGQRASRDLDFRGQLETLTSRIGTKVKNVTCVMQELGYLDDNLEPNVERIAERISRLPVGDELKKDMMDGVQFCKQFSECVPEMRNGKFQLSKEMEKPMFFFKCYKYKKLEACIMQDVRERYSQQEMTKDPMGGPELRSFSEGDRLGADEDIALAVYEFLNGGEAIGMDTIM